MATAVKATSRLNIPQQFVHVCKYPDWLNCMLGSHPLIPAAPHRAGALLCCPPYLELYSYTELPRLCRKHTQCLRNTGCVEKHLAVVAVSQTNAIHKTQKHLFYPANQSSNSKNYSRILLRIIRHKVSEDASQWF